MSLLALFHAAARGQFPPGDNSTAHLPSPTSPTDGVFAFFGHHVIASDVAPSFVEEWTARDPFALSDVRFLAALADQLGVAPGIYDAVFAAIGEGASAVDGLTETADRSHPRVVRALRYRDPRTIRVYTYESGAGTLVMGRGVAGRMEAAYEVDPSARAHGIGARLIDAARRLAPVDEPVFLQVSPGNVWSMKALARLQGWTSVGSEVLYLRASDAAHVD